MTDVVRRLEQRLYRDVKDTCERYELLAPGDRIMVAMSGGKDSYTLFHLLTRLVPRLPFGVELVAVHLDQVQPGYDGSGAARATSRPRASAFEILREDTYSVVTDAPRRDARPTARCARACAAASSTPPPSGSAATRSRSATTATTRSRRSCSTCSTRGKLQAMPASYRTDDGRFEVIRPLIECAEADIADVREPPRVPDHPVQPVRLAGRASSATR